MSMPTKESVVQLSILPERVAVVEVQVKNLNEKVDDLKIDVKDMHECLDLTRDGIMQQLNKMHEESCAQHNELAGKVKEIQTFKNKVSMYIMATLAFAAGTGWLNSVSFPHILKFIGI